MSIALSWNERLARLGSKLPEQMAQAIMAQKEMEVRDETYYQRVRLSADSIVVGSGVHTQTHLAKKIQCFAYGQNQPMADAGFPSAVPWLKATEVDTNLMNGGRTNNSELFGIEAVSFTFLGQQDVDLMAALLPHVTASLSVGGQANYRRLGMLHKMPQSGGIWGAGETRLRTPHIGSVIHGIPGVPSNGPPAESIGLDLKETIVWGPAGTVGIQHLFTVDLQLWRDRVITSTARAADAANEVAAYTPPVAQAAYTDTPGSFLEFFVELHGLRVASRIGL